MKSLKKAVAKEEKQQAKLSKPRNPAAQYTNLRVKELKEDPLYKTNPKTGLKLKHSDYLAIALREWDEFTDDEKHPYVKLADED